MYAKYVADDEEKQDDYSMIVPPLLLRHSNIFDDMVARARATAALLSKEELQCLLSPLHVRFGIIP